MSKISWRTGVLVITLLLPVLIYLFLQTFGENHYTLPVYTITDKPENGCENASDSNIFPALHLRSSSGSETSNSTLFKKVTITVFVVDQQQSDGAVLTELLRISSAFRNKPEVQILVFYNQENKSDFLSNLITNFQESRQVQILGLNKTNQFQLAKCTFFIDLDNKESDEKISLVDQKGQIRGYYNLQSRKEMDRLILETKILLHENETNKGS